MKIAVFGAAGKTGRVVVQQALDAGHTVTAVSRRPAEPGIAGETVRWARADATDAAAVAEAIAGQDAVISVLGVPFGKEPITIYSAGTANVMAGMAAHGVRRLVCVSSSAIEPDPDSQEGWLFEKVLQPYIVNGIGKTTYDDMRAMEHAVRASDLDWTIVRPSGLFGADVVSDYAISAGGHLPGRYTSRADLANALLRLATAPEHVGRAVEVRTTVGTPNFFAFLWREALGH